MAKAYLDKGGDLTGDIKVMTFFSPNGVKQNEKQEENLFSDDDDLGIVGPTPRMGM